MTRRRTTNAENILKAHRPLEKADAPELIVEPAVERTHMQALIQFLAEALDEPPVETPKKIKIISRLTSSDTELMKVDDGPNSEWKVYIPDLRDPSLAYFKDSFVQSSTNSDDVAHALSSFKDRLPQIKNRMGLLELQYLLKQPKEVIVALLRDAGVKEKDLRTKYIIFPETRFRAQGRWHTLSLGYAADGKYQAFAIPLADLWQDDFFILAGTTK